MEGDAKGERSRQRAAGAEARGPEGTWWVQGRAGWGGEAGVWAAVGSEDGDRSGRASQAAVGGVTEPDRT